MIYRGGSGAKQGELGKMVFKAKEEGTANLILNGEFYNEESKLIQTGFGSLKLYIEKQENILGKEGIQEQNNTTDKSNTKLQELRIDVAGMIPDFDTNVYKYDLTVTSDIRNIQVLAIPENANSTIEVTGNNDLKQGISMIKIKVISEDKTQEEIYEIEVTKTENLEMANTNLEILAVENELLDPAFEANITEYKVNISNDVTKLNILAIPENEQGKIKVTGNDNLKEGNNVITINVIAPNEISTREYKINAYKRNIKEEEEFQKEQENQEKKLEEAYKIEKLSSTNEKATSEEIKQNVNNYFIIIGVSILLIIISSIGIIYYIKKKR